MEVTAKARYIRMSARKVRLIADLVRGMDLGSAINQLRFYRKAAARPVLKLVQSAAANAAHNNKLDPANLYLSKITVDIGPSMKRYRPRAFGRAAEIKKHMCHINVTLSERGSTGPGAKKAMSAAALKPKLDAAGKNAVSKDAKVAKEGKKPAHAEKSATAAAKDQAAKG